MHAGGESDKMEHVEPEQKGLALEAKDKDPEQTPCVCANWIFKAEKNALLPTHVYHLNRELGKEVCTGNLGEGGAGQPW